MKRGWLTSFKWVHQVWRADCLLPSLKLRINHFLMYTTLCLYLDRIRILIACWSPVNILIIYLSDGPSVLQISRTLNFLLDDWPDFILTLLFLFLTEYIYVCNCGCPCLTRLGFPHISLVFHIVFANTVDRNCIIFFKHLTIVPYISLCSRWQMMARDL